MLNAEPWGDRKVLGETHLLLFDPLLHASRSAHSQLHRSQSELTMNVQAHLLFGLCNLILRHPFLLPLLRAPKRYRERPISPFPTPADSACQCATHRCRLLRFAILAASLTIVVTPLSSAPFTLRLAVSLLLLCLAFPLALGLGRACVAVLLVVLRRCFLLALGVGGCGTAAEQVPLLLLREGREELPGQSADLAIVTDQPPLSSRK